MCPAIGRTLTAEEIAMPQPARRRAERVEARVSREQKRMFERAAGLEGRSFPDFLLASAEAAAASTISRYELLKLTPADSQTFVAALLNPPKPNKTLQAATARYLQRQRG
jgi:uncharacterized protein (DUF1778 family)